MSTTTRGQEVTIRVSVDGEPLAGSFLKVTNFTSTPKQEIQEFEYLGEDETDFGFQHSGFDLQWEIHQSDSASLDLAEQLIELERNHQRHPPITITVIYDYRDEVTPGRVVAYFKVTLAQGEEGFKGRKDPNSVQYTAKAKRRRVLQA